jgi:AraC-like DNA-binding protein
MKEKIKPNDSLKARVRFRQPAPAVAPFVYRMLMGGSQLGSPPIPAFQEKILPLPYSIIGYREYHPAPGKDRGRREFILFGPQGKLYEEKGMQSEITTIVIKPGGTRALTGVSGAEAVDKLLPMDKVWGAEGKSLFEKMILERDQDKRMDLLEQALLKRLPPHPEEDLYVVESAAFIEQQMGKGTLEAFFDQTGYSRRQVLNHFKELIGFSPKHFARIVRLRNLFKNLDLKPELDWAKLAQEHGYSDQAHLVREFRKLMGTTPARFAKEFRECGMFLPGADNSVLLFRKDAS